MAEHSANPLDHVVDHPNLEFPWFTGPHYELIIDLPKIGGVQITRFMVMELVAAVLLIADHDPGRPAHRANPVSRGWFMNMFEAVLMFVRDQIARPSIGGHGADRFLALSLDGVFLHPVQQLARDVSRGSLRRRATST